VNVERERVDESFVSHVGLVDIKHFMGSIGSFDRGLILSGTTNLSRLWHVVMLTLKHCKHIIGK